MSEAEERRKEAYMAELCLLSACIQWAEVADITLESGRADMFSDPRHRLIFEGMQRVRSRGELPGLVAVEGELRKAGRVEQAGGGAYLAEVFEAVVVPDQAQDHLRMVRRYARLRSLGAEAKRLARIALDAHHTEADVLEETFERMVAAYVGDGAADRLPAATLAEVVADYALNRAPMLEGIREPIMPGLITGLAALDQALVWRPGQLYALTADTGGGKTTLAWWVACQIAKLSGLTSVYFSIEMPKEFLALRHISTSTRIGTTQLERGPLTKGEVLDVKGVVPYTPSVVIYDQGAGTSISAAPRLLRQLQREGHKIGLVVFDLLARYELPEGWPRRTTRQEEVTDLTRYASEIAKRFSAPVLNLIQLNAGGTLRESAVPGHDGDYVMVLTVEKPERKASILFRKTRFGDEIHEGHFVDMSFDPRTGAFWEPPAGGWPAKAKADPSPPPRRASSRNGWGGDAKSRQAGDED